MAIARVVTFDGVSSERMAEMQGQMSEGGPPEGFPPAEFMALHDPAAERTLVVIIFETEDDFEKADAILNAMPAGDTPGKRTSVARYDVALRMKS